LNFGLPLNQFSNNQSLNRPGFIGDSLVPIMLH